jgi:hypothetical protein
LSAARVAAWRRRHRIVKALLVAGASASVSARKPLGALHETPEEEDRLTDLLTRRRGGGFDFATAAHVVGCVVRMRTIAARDEGLGLPLGACVRCAATGSSVSFDPCGCVVCEGCVWRRVLSEAQGGGVQGDVRCPQCAAVCPLRGHGGSDGAKGGAGGAKGSAGAIHTAPLESFWGVPLLRVFVGSANATRSAAEQAELEATLIEHFIALVAMPKPLLGLAADKKGGKADKKGKAALGPSSAEALLGTVDEELASKLVGMLGITGIDAILLPYAQRLAVGL